jgi:hypothetical protein
MRVKAAVWSSFVRLARKTGAHAGANRSRRQMWTRARWRSRPPLAGAERCYGLTPAACRRGRAISGVSWKNAGAIFCAREYLNKARLADLAGKVDLGPRFVQRLEQALDIRLRWCPASTDSGVYVRAYQSSSDNSGAPRMIVHVVNYRVPIEVKAARERGANAMGAFVSRAGAPHTQRRLHITVPLPPGMVVKAIDAFSPTEPPSPVSWKMEGDSAAIEIRRVQIYQALVVTMAKKSEMR